MCSFFNHLLLLIIFFWCHWRRKKGRNSSQPCLARALLPQPTQWSPVFTITDGHGKAMSSLKDVWYYLAPHRTQHHHLQRAYWKQLNPSVRCPSSVPALKNMGKFTFKFMIFKPWFVHILVMVNKSYLVHYSINLLEILVFSISYVM